MTRSPLHSKTELKPINGHAVAAILIGSVVFLLALGAAAFAMRTCDCDFWSWLNSGPVTMDSVLLGFGTGLAFGAIDNVLLFCGISALDAVFQRLPGGTDPVTNAAYGNAFSSALSAFGSVFVGQLISDITKQTKTTLWAQAIGVFIGGLLGIVLSMMLMGAIRGVSGKKTSK